MYISQDRLDYATVKCQNLSELRQQKFSLILHVHHGSAGTLCPLRLLRNLNWWRLHLDMCFTDHYSREKRTQWIMHWLIKASTYTWHMFLLFTSYWPFMSSFVNSVQISCPFFNWAVYITYIQKSAQFSFAFVQLCSSHVFVTLGTPTCSIKAF